MDFIKRARVTGVLGDHIDTDVIYPARYLVLFAPDEVKLHLFEDIDPGLAARLQGGAILGGEDFGCGSAREQGLTPSPSSRPIARSPCPSLAARGTSWRPTSPPGC